MHRHSCYWSPPGAEASLCMTNITALLFFLDIWKSSKTTSWDASKFFLWTVLFILQNHIHLDAPQLIRIVDILTKDESDFDGMIWNRKKQQNKNSTKEVLNNYVIKSFCIVSNISSSPEQKACTPTNWTHVVVFYNSQKLKKE